MKRKYVKTFESYVHSLKEGIDWSDSSDIDMDDFVSAAEAKKLLKSAKPFPLTGKVKQDGEKLIKLAVDTFKKHGIELDATGVTVDSENFRNGIKIPIKGVDPETVCLETNLDYSDSGPGRSKDMGRDMEVQFSFYTYEDGNQDFFDITNSAEVKKAATAVKKYLPKNESRINESKGGPKVQKFLKLIKLKPAALSFFADAEGGQGLHKGWHDAKKKLGLTDDNAIICFADAVSDYDDMLSAAEKAGLKFIEVFEESDDDNGGIIFDVNQ